jgi:glycosyltransferase involved in cell wall biosynthesis
MRILILTQHFAPEITAARARLESFADGLAGAGHEVSVICAVPNHPEGAIHDGFRGRLSMRAQENGYAVQRLWVLTSPERTTARRLALYGSFAAMATIAGCLASKPEVILASSPPLPVGAAAAAVAARHRVPWVFDVRDLWPDVAVALGELTNPRMVRAAERLEHRLYRSAAAITTTTEPFHEAVAMRSGDPGKVTVLPNGTTRLWLDAGELEVSRQEVDLPEDRFVWTYAGNLGIAQGLETAIGAAGILGEGYRLVLLGEGPHAGRLREHAAAMPPGSVEFRGLAPAPIAVRLLRASDALLVTLGANPALRKFVPSKLFDYCAVGRPVVLAASGESRRLAEDAGAVIGVEPGDPQALAAAIRSLHDDERLRAELEAAGPRFAEPYLREHQVNRLDALLTEVAGR